MVMDKKESSLEKIAGFVQRYLLLFVSTVFFPCTFCCCTFPSRILRSVFGNLKRDQKFEKLVLEGERKMKLGRDGANVYDDSDNEEEMEFQDVGKFKFDREDEDDDDDDELETMIKELGAGEKDEPVTEKPVEEQVGNLGEDEVVNIEEEEGGEEVSREEGNPQIDASMASVENDNSDLKILKFLESKPQEEFGEDEDPTVVVPNDIMLDVPIEEPIMDKDSNEDDLHLLGDIPPYGGEMKNLEADFEEPKEEERKFYCFDVSCQNEEPKTEEELVKHVINHHQDMLYMLTQKQQEIAERLKGNPEEVDNVIM